MLDNLTAKLTFWYNFQLYLTIIIKMPILNLQFSFFKCCFLGFLCFLFSQNIVGQKQFYQIYEANQLIKSDSFINEKEATQYATFQLNKWLSNGYLLASLDSINNKKIHLFKGTVFNTIIVKNIITDDWQDQEKQVNHLVNKKYLLPKFTILAERLITNYANHGYPFAKLAIRNKKILDNGIECDLTFDKGPLIIFDTLAIKSDVKLSPSFIKNYLGIFPGAPYSEKSINQINRKLSTLPFLKLEQIPLISFNQNKASLALELTKNKINKIDALIGFAPQSDNNNNKLLFTGQADIQLHNITGSAEKFTLNWQSFIKNSQSLNTTLSLPYLPFLNFGTDLSFELLKFDSTFLTTKPQLALTYRNIKNVKFSAFYKSEQTSLLSIDTSNIRNSFNFPSPNATKLVQYGLSIENKLWNNINNPWSGFSYFFMGAVGQKNINKDNRVERVVFSDGTNTYNLYDSLKLSFSQFNFHLNIANMLPLHKQKWVLFTALDAKTIRSDKVFFNELFRLGGYKTLRGFDEQSIFANQYAMLNLELRYRFDENSNVFVFGNTMYYENKSENFTGVKQDIPFGFGLGANINTGNTILSMVYGYGIQKNIPLNFSKGKFHFGLVNYF